MPYLNVSCSRLLRLRSLTFVRAGFHVSAQANCLPYRSCCRKEISPRVLSPSWPGVAALWPMSTTVASGGPLGRSHSAPVPCRAFLAISHMHGRSPGSPAEPQTSLSARLSRRVRRPMTSRSRSSTMAIQPSRRRIASCGVLELASPEAILSASRSDPQVLSALRETTVRSRARAPPLPESPEAVRC